MVQDKVLIIDYRNRRFMINVLPSWTNLLAEEFESEYGGIKLPLRINGKTCKVLFDTGSSPFQLITTQERAWSVSDLTIVDSLSDYFMVGTRNNILWL